LPGAALAGPTVPEVEQCNGFRQRFVDNDFATFPRVMRVDETLVQSICQVAQ